MDSLRSPQRQHNPADTSEPACEPDVELWETVSFCRVKDQVCYRSHTEEILSHCRASYSAGQYRRFVTIASVLLKLIPWTTGPRLWSLALPHTLLTQHLQMILKNHF